MGNFRTGGLILTLAAALAAPRAARAEGKSSFEQIAGDAIRVDRGQLATALWALRASCSDGDDLAKRECRVVRDAIVARYEGQMLIVPADASAFSVGEFDAKKKAAPIALSGCIACVDPIAVDGAALYVTADKAATGWNGAVATAAPVHEAARKFASEAAATKWRAAVAPRLGAELLVDFPKTLKTWKDGDKSGVTLAVLGFRVYDPCDGSIVDASPSSGPVAIDKVACGGAVADGAEGDDSDGGEEAAPEALPDELSAAQIKAAMAPVREAAQKCFDKYGVEGDTKLHVTVSGDGTVVAIDQSGNFDDTPTGTCIEEAAKQATFPKTSKAKQSFKYPIVLR